MRSHHAFALLLICCSVGCGSATEPQTMTATDPVVIDPVGPWSTIAVGDAHTCGLTKAGVAYCWGWNDRNELGDGTFDARSSPTLVSSSLRFVSITAGRFVTCGIASSAEAYCWGLLNRGVTFATPHLVQAGLRFTALAVGQFKVCGIGTDGSVYCWSTIGSDPDTPALLPGNLRFRTLSSAKVRFCGATIDGKAYCWADAVAWSQSIAQLQPVVSSTSVLALAGGDTTGLLNQFHGCAIAADSTAVCWGGNSFGQLGDSTYADRASSVAVRGGLKLTNIYAMYGRSCAVSVTGQAYCWGVPIQCVPAPQVGSFSQPACVFPGGLPATPTRPFPTAWLSGIRIVSLSLGTDHSCALTGGGALYCWGANDRGQLGLGQAGGSFGEPRRIADPSI